MMHVVGVAGLLLVALLTGCLGAWTIFFTRICLRDCIFLGILCFMESANFVMIAESVIHRSL